MDGACAALLHITQSEKVKNYYVNRRNRLNEPQHQDSIIYCHPRVDKFLQITLNNELFRPEILTGKRSNTIDFTESATFVSHSNNEANGPIPTE